MKKLILSLLFLLGLTLSISYATPYYPNGIPGIGPLEGTITFWGRSDEGGYFDGTGYGKTFLIPLPQNQSLKLNVSARITSHQNLGTKNSYSFNIDRTIEGFTGDFNLYIFNSKEEVIVKNYHGTLNVPDTGSYFTHYKTFDLKEIPKDSKIDLELLMEDGSTLKTRLDQQTVQDLIFIDQTFPDSDD